VPDPEQLMPGFHAEAEALQWATQALREERAGVEVVEASMKALNAMLDKALTQVDALLKEKG
jgi:hypothetical protein